jgi:hypothetical protein
MAGFLSYGISYSYGMLVFEIAAIHATGGTYGVHL